MDTFAMGFAGAIIGSAVAVILIKVYEWWYRRKD